VLLLISASIQAYAIGFETSRVNPPLGPTCPFAQGDVLVVMRKAPIFLAIGFAAVAIPLAAFGQADSRKITEVTLERTPCFGGCPIYKVTLRSDGTATYDGMRNVDKIGKYEGRFWDRDFERLSNVIDKFGYWKLNEKYRLPITDQASQILTVKSDKGAKTVDEYGDSGPEELWAIQLVVDGIAGNVRDWKKVD
jgi:hypothetical protein